METSNIYALFLICILFIFSVTPVVGSCAFCGTAPPKHTSPPTVKPPIRPPPIKRPPVTFPPTKPPVTVPPTPPTKPPVTAPPTKPPVTVPPAPLTKPPVTVPPIVIPPMIPLPPIVIPPVIPLPPIGLIPPVILPPIFEPPVTPPPGTPPPILKPPTPPAKETCPIDTLKLGSCVDLLGGLLHSGLGDMVVNECCPVLQGLKENEAAVCMCTTLKKKLLNLNTFVPLARQLLATCGKTPASGYTCSQ